MGQFTAEDGSGTGTVGFGAGLRQRPPGFAWQRISDWLEDGTLAATAWSGFQRLPTFGAYRILEAMGKLGCDVADLDSLAPISEARQRRGPKASLLGNLNPVTVLRDGDPAGVTAAIVECHRQAGAPLIVGAGCEVPRDTPAENLRALCAYAHTHQP